MLQPDIQALAGGAPSYFGTVVNGVDVPEAAQPFVPTTTEERAAMTSLDHRGGTWRYELGGNTVVLTVPWTTEIGERAEIRREIVVLYDAVCARLGITPRPH